MNQRSASRLFAPRTVVLLVTAVYFFAVLVFWLRDPFWNLHKEMYISAQLFIAAVALALNKPLSNLLAAVLGGQLPLAIFYDFWMFAKHAEIPIFGSQHVYMGMTDITLMGLQPILWCVLSIVMLSLAVNSISRALSNRVLPRDGGGGGLP